MILAGSVAAVTVGAELAVRQWGLSASCVQVVNEGDEPISDLVLSYAGTTLRHGTLPAGQATKVWFSPAGKGPLRLGFIQKGNGLSGFEYAEFDPDAVRGAGNMLVLVVKPNQIDRYMESDDRSGQPQGVMDRIIEMVRNASRERQ